MSWTVFMPSALVRHGCYANGLLIGWIDDVSRVAVAERLETSLRTNEKACIGSVNMSVASETMTSPLHVRLTVTDNPDLLQIELEHCSDVESGVTLIIFDADWLTGWLMENRYCLDCLSTMYGNQLSILCSMWKQHVVDEKKMDCSRCVVMDTQTEVAESYLTQLFRHSYTWCVLNHRWNSKSKCDTSHSTRRFWCSLAFDWLLGILLSWLLLYGYVARLTDNKIVESMETFIELAVRHLGDLLVWLMGAPAGLKLNRTLAWFLGQFYTYHLKIWHSYISLLLTPQAPVILRSLPWITCGGLTLLLGVLLDCLSLASLHLLCFYIYACKLFGMQVGLLVSLWRLFRGVKWNPLRWRQDSTPSSHRDRLFGSTLLLALCLFLLPTTALFYTVFTAIRVLLLLVQGLLCGLIVFCLECPAYSLCLCLIGSHKIRDKFVFRFVRGDGRNLVLALEITAPSLIEVYRRRSYNTQLFGGGYSMKKYLSNILRGSLLYP